MTNLTSGLFVLKANDFFLLSYDIKSFIIITLHVVVMLELSSSNLSDLLAFS